MRIHWDLSRCHCRLLLRVCLLRQYHLYVSFVLQRTPADSQGQTIELPAEIFAKPMRKDVLHRCVVWYLANLRQVSHPAPFSSSGGADVQGSQSTKSRSTINYSGRKLRQQKGTGKARVGDAGSGIRMSPPISWYASTNNQDVVVHPFSLFTPETTPNSSHVKSGLSVCSLLYLPNSQQVS
jgi:hypothetical protein